MITLCCSTIKALKKRIIKFKESISVFMEDIIINKLNGYYLQVYASGHTRFADVIILKLSFVFINIMVLFHVIPARIKYRNF